jgi:hypothetical protein
MGEKYLLGQPFKDDFRILGEDDKPEVRNYEDAEDSTDDETGQRMGWLW